MAIYIINYVALLFLLFATTIANFNNQIKILTYFFSVIWLVLFVGLRHEVGADWYNYLYHFQEINIGINVDMLLSWDPGYILVEYISKKLNLGLYGVNTICAILFFGGLSQFIRTININFILGYIIAYPYLIMVVASGYTRQAASLGMIFFFYAFLYKKYYIRALVSFFIAVLFHKTAIIAAFVLVEFIKPTKFFSKRFLFIIIIALISFGFVYLFRESLYLMYINYFLEKMHSYGAYYRILINIFASLVLIIFARRWMALYKDFEFWKPFIYFSFLALIFSFILNITTIVDRLLLYFYPLQLVVFGRMVYLIRDRSVKYIFFLFILCFYFSVLVLWLNFAVHRHAWIPYDNLLFRLF